MWGRRLAAMLALYTSKGVTTEGNLREHISCMPPPSANKAESTLALKPTDVTRSPKQGYQWSHKWTCVQQKYQSCKQMPSYYSQESVELGIRGPGVQYPLVVTFCYWNLLFSNSKASDAKTGIIANVLFVFVKNSNEVFFQITFSANVAA